MNKLYYCIQNKNITNNNIKNIPKNIISNIEYNSVRFEIIMFKTILAKRICEIHNFRLTNSCDPKTFIDI